MFRGTPHSRRNTLQHRQQRRVRDFMPRRTLGPRSENRQTQQCPRACGSGSCTRSPTPVMCREGSAVFAAQSFIWRYEQRNGSSNAAFGYTPELRLRPAGRAHAVQGSLSTPCRTCGRCSRCCAGPAGGGVHSDRNNRNTCEHLRFAANARGTGERTRAPAPGGTLADSPAEETAVARAAVRRGARRKFTTTAPKTLPERRKPPRERGLSLAVPVGFEPTGMTLTSSDAQRGHLFTSMSCLGRVESVTDVLAKRPPFRRGAADEALRLVGCK